MQRKQKKHELARKLSEQLQRELEIHQELKQAVHMEQSLKDEQATREELQEMVAREESHGRALQMQVYVGCPDWTGSRQNWQPLQAVQKHDYLLDKTDRLERASASHLQLQLFKQPCAFGGMRYATFARMQDGTRLVAKRILKEGRNLERNRKVLEADVRCMCIANRIADGFNQALRQTSLPKCFKEARVTFNVPSIMTVPDDDAACGKAVYLLEPHLPGEWRKWLQNDGSTFPGRDVPALLEAFVHYSYHDSRSDGDVKIRLMVLDLQGNLTQNRGPGPACSCFQLTDPSISTVADDTRFGETNHGIEGIHKFLHGHQCSEGMTRGW
ncbi:hypothetical protein WJX84_003219 [Apatococcus fuscideae]|uniref:Alpha-type protein kinase domain-containing protein n=1 Tax=Apatococcus fuscideae TaxID=2026836 RepID=A0AAW1T626_9CHLO